MLNYILLVIVQCVAAFLGAGMLIGRVPVTGNATTFVHAAIYAGIVWAVGLIGSLVLRGVRRPTVPTLVSALLGALIGATIMMIPAALHPVQALLHVPPLYLPLAGAIVGYLMRS